MSYFKNVPEMGVQAGHLPRLHPHFRSFYGKCDFIELLSLSYVEEDRKMVCVGAYAPTHTIFPEFLAKSEQIHFKQ